jgi:Cu(I)/Ag(I) efflux system protein CusF
MRDHFSFVILIVCCLFSACSNAATTRNEDTSYRTPVPNATMAPQAREGDYPGVGTVTKINNELGSLELDHEEIPGLMPAMRMEFFITDKAMLNGLRVGDRVDFVLRHKASSETILSVTKAK